MHTIIRVEHADGWGMFRYDEVNNGPDYSRYTLGNSEETYEMYCLHAIRNIPTKDGIEMHDDMFCAFESLETFNALVIPEELSWLLKNHNFKVLMLDVTHIEKGKHQVCYRKKDVIQTKDITKLFL
jgi:hypothetical protein